LSRLWRQLGNHSAGAISLAVADFALSLAQQSVIRAITQLEAQYFIQSDNFSAQSCVCHSERDRTCPSGESKSNWRGLVPRNMSERADTLSMLKTSQRAGSKMQKFSTRPYIRHFH